MLTHNHIFIQRMLAYDPFLSSARNWRSTNPHKLLPNSQVRALPIFQDSSGRLLVKLSRWCLLRLSWKFGSTWTFSSHGPIFMVVVVWQGRRCKCSSCLPFQKTSVSRAKKKISLPSYTPRSTIYCSHEYLWIIFSVRKNIFQKIFSRILCVFVWMGESFLFLFSIMIHWHNWRRSNQYFMSDESSDQINCNTDITRFKNMIISSSRIKINIFESSK